MEKIGKFSIRQEEFIDDETQESTKYNVLTKDGYKIKTITEEDVGKTFKIDATKEIWFNVDEKQTVLDLLKGK